MTSGFDTAEYRASNYAVAADALTAYNAGATGKGIKIGVVDTGINPTLSEFAGKIDPASGDVAGNRGVSDEDGHGTAVSAVAAAARNGSNTMGVAFDATIVNLRADNPGSCATSEGCQFYDGAVADGIDAARLAGAKVINLSLGGSTPGSQLLAAMQRAVEAGIVLVISAGNDSLASPDSFALSPANQFPGMVIIAGSVGVSGVGGTINVDQLSSFSNKAGSGSQYYLAALGYQDRAPGADGQQYLWSGTSFAAPTISGAVALLAQAFPNLTGQQIVDLLLRSADDLGVAGTDSIFGRGRLNLGRAFLPVGTTTMAGTEQVVSTSDNGDLPEAAGDAATGQSLGAIILDGFDRAYALNLAKTLRRAEASSPLARSLRNDLRSVSVGAGPLNVMMTVRERRDLPLGFSVDQPAIGPEDYAKARLVAGSALAKIDDKTAIAFGFAEGAKAMERRLNSAAAAGGFLVARDVTGDPGFTAKRNGSVALRREIGKLGVTVSAESGNVWNDARTSATGSLYRWTSVAIDRRFGAMRLGLGMSRLDEKDSLLGGRLGDALGGGGSSSLFLDAEARQDFGRGWSAALTARRGWTSFNAGRFETGAYGVDFGKAGVFGPSDRLGFRVAQPLRIEKGGLGMLLPTGYDYSTSSATMGYASFPLVPRGREVDGEISYGSALFGNRAWIGGNLFYRRDPGHIRAGDDDKGAAIRFTIGF
ncbi:MAG: S8 family peptidase [Sphingomicrobium sp.]